MRAFKPTTSSSIQTFNASRPYPPPLPRLSTSSSSDAQHSPKRRMLNNASALFERFSPIFFIFSTFAFSVFCSNAESSSSSILLPMHRFSYAPCQSPVFVRAFAATL